MNRKWFMYESGDRETTCFICNQVIRRSARRYWNRDTRQVICASCYDDEQQHYNYPQKGFNTTGVDGRSTATTIPPVDPPLEGAAKGHDENMKSAELTRVAVQALTAAIVDLMRVEEDRNKLLVRNMEAKA